MYPWLAPGGGADPGFCPCHVHSHHLPASAPITALQSPLKKPGPLGATTGLGVQASFHISQASVKGIQRLGAHIAPLSIFPCHSVPLLQASSDGWAPGGGFSQGCERALGCGTLSVAYPSCPPRSVTAQGRRAMLSRQGGLWAGVWGSLACAANDRTWRGPLGSRMAPRLEASSCACDWEGTFGVSSVYHDLWVFGAPHDASLSPQQSFWAPTALSSSLATEASWASAPSTWMSTGTGSSSGGRMRSTPCSWTGPAQMPRR